MVERLKLGGYGHLLVTTGFIQSLRLVTIVKNQNVVVLSLELPHFSFVRVCIVILLYRPKFGIESCYVLSEVVRSGIVTIPELGKRTMIRLQPESLSRGTWLSSN